MWIMWRSAGPADLLIMNMLTDMKNFRNILFSFAALLAFHACEGTADDTSLPVLSADTYELDIVDGGSVTFTVTYNGKDVTSGSRVTCLETGSALSSAVFTPEKTGIYTFTAAYGSMESEPVTVTVVNSRPQVNSIYNRRVCIMEMTGAWCTWCPEGYSNINRKLQSKELWKNNVHILALHSASEEGGEDELAIDVTDYIHAMFRNGALSYPSFIVDMRDCGEPTVEGWTTVFDNAMNASFNEYTPHCGVAVSSVLDKEASECEITVEVASELSAAYRVAVFLVEDKVIYYQKLDASMIDYEYSHRHVARKLVTDYDGKFSGVRMTEDGMIAEGETVSASWTASIDPEWNTANMEVYALVLDGNGYVNNMNVCSVDGGDSGFDLK